MMNSKWRLPHPATMFLLLTLAVIVLSWIFDIYGLSVFQPQTGEEIRVQSLLSPEGVRWLLRHVVTNFTGFAPLGLVIVALSKFISLGHLPGDIFIKGEHGSFYFPIVSCIVLSVVLSVILNLFHR